MSRLNELDENSNVRNTNLAIFTANFLKNELKNGNTIEKVVGEEVKIRAFLDNISNSDERKKVASFLVAQGTSQNIILLVQNNEWKKFRDNPENIKILNELFLGNGKIPEIVYPKHNIMFIFWLAIFIIQISVFIGYLKQVNDGYHYPKFYQLQWGKVGTYIVILFLSPGMWVIVIPWALWKFVVLDISDIPKFLRERKEEKQVKKDLERKAMEKSFDPAVIREKFSSHRKQSETLLQKLELKLQKERGTA